MNNKNITITQLLSQIETLLKDEFIANVENETSHLAISFLNGQKFILNITEEN